VVVAVINNRHYIMTVSVQFSSFLVFSSINILGTSYFTPKFVTSQRN